MEVSDKTFKGLANFAERLIGYLYAGILPLVIITLENRDMVEQFIKAVGGILTAIITITLGIGIYTLYFRVFGELIIYPLQHLLHILIDKIFLHPPERSSSTIRFLHHLGVPWIRCRDAYQDIKDTLFTEQVRREIQISHGELHVIYLTSLITLFAYFIIEFTAGGASRLYLLISIICFLAALLGDTRQHSREAFIFCNRKEVVRQLLVDFGYLESKES